MLFIAFVIIIIHNGLPQGTLPLCLNVKLKCLCSAHKETIWPGPPVNGFRKEDINPSPPQCWPSQAKLTAFLLYFLTSCPSLFYKSGIQTLVRWLFWDISLPSSQSAGFPNKVAIPCLNTSPPDLLACSVCVASKGSLDSVTMCQLPLNYYAKWVKLKLRPIFSTLSGINNIVTILIYTKLSESIYLSWKVFVRSVYWAFRMSTDSNYTHLCQLIKYSS